MTMKCSPLLLPPSSIPSPHPELTVLSLPSALVPSVDSRRLLVSSARRRETAAIRERWKQQHQQPKAKSEASRFRHPLSAPPGSSMSSRSAGLDPRKWLVAHGYRTSDESDVPCKERPLQFPQLEEELRKRNLTERLPYYVKLEVEREGRLNYPQNHPSYNQVFFLSAGHRAHKPSSPSQNRVPRARCLRSDREERFFIHPEWSSETVGWQRLVHNSTPVRFRYSWM